MAKFIHVVLRLPERSDKLLVRAKVVLAALVDNLKFPAAGALLLELDDRIQDLETAMTSGTATERRAGREAVRETLSHLRNHVQSVAEKGAGTVDLEAIRALVESAAMSLRKVTRPPKLVFAAKHGPVPGSVDLTAPHSPKRDTHEWEMSTDLQVWTTLPGTRQAKTRVTGLPVDVTHHFRHRLLTKDGYTAWSDPTAMIVVK